MTKINLVVSIVLCSIVLSCAPGENKVFLEDLDSLALQGIPGVDGEFIYKEVKIIPIDTGFFRLTSTGAGLEKKVEQYKGAYEYANEESQDSYWRKYLPKKSSANKQAALKIKSSLDIMEGQLDSIKTEFASGDLYVVRFVEKKLGGHKTCNQFRCFLYNTDGKLETYMSQGWTDYVPQVYTYTKQEALVLVGEIFQAVDISFDYWYSESLKKFLVSEQLFCKEDRILQNL